MPLPNAISKSLNEFSSTQKKYSINKRSSFILTLQPKLGSKLNIFPSDLLQLYCFSANIPEYGFFTEDNFIDSANRRHYIYGFEYSSLRVSFNLDSNLIIRQFFEEWKKTIFNERRVIGYFDDYAIDALLTVQNNENKPVCTYSFSGLFPKSIGDIPYDWQAASEKNTISIDFQFEKMVPMFDNEVVSSSLLSFPKQIQSSLNSISPSLNNLAQMGLDVGLKTAVGSSTGQLITSTKSLIANTSASINTFTKVIDSSDIFGNKITGLEKIRSATDLFNVNDKLPLIGQDLVISSKDIFDSVNNAEGLYRSITAPDVLNFPSVNLALSQTNQAASNFSASIQNTQAQFINPFSLSSPTGPALPSSQFNASIGSIVNAGLNLSININTIRNVLRDGNIANFISKEAGARALNDLILYYSNLGKTVDNTTQAIATLPNANFNVASSNLSKANDFAALAIKEISKIKI